MKVAICTHSILHSIVVGESYEVKQRKHGKLVDIGSYIGVVDGDDITISGVGGSVFATLSTADAKEIERKQKSMMKMLVRAFKNEAKSRGWGDSKNGMYKSWGGTPFKNSSQWARHMAHSYELGEVARDIMEDDPNVKFIDQEAVNLFAGNEIDNW